MLNLLVDTSGFKMTKKYKLDRLDLNILAALRQEARMTKIAIGEKVGLSPTPCHERIRKMEKSKIIKGYHADLDLRLITELSFFFVRIEIRNYSKERARVFEQVLRTQARVVEAYSLIGNIDYLLQIAARNINDYQLFITELIDIDGIDIDYWTYPMTKEVVKSFDVGLLDLIAAVEDQSL